MILNSTSLDDLSKREISILLYLLLYQQVNGVPPLVMEIVRAYPYLPYSTVLRDLNLLIQRGWLYKAPGKFRNLRLKF